MTCVREVFPQILPIGEYMTTKIQFAIRFTEFNVRTLIITMIGLQCRRRGGSGGGGGGSVYLLTH